MYKQEQQEIDPDPVAVQYVTAIDWFRSWSSPFSPGLSTLPVVLGFTKLLAYCRLFTGICLLIVRVFRVFRFIAVY